MPPIAGVTEGTASNSECFDRSSSGESDENSGLDSGRLYRQRSASTWTNKEIDHAIWGMQAEKRALMTEQKIMDMNSELKKVKPAGEKFERLVDRVENIEKVIVDEKQDRVERNPEIVTMKREVEGIKTEVQELDQQLTQITKSFEVLLKFLVKKGSDPNDRAHLKELKKHISQGCKPSPRDFTLDKKNVEKFKARYKEAFVNESCTENQLISPTLEVEKSYDFETFTQFERADLRTCSISFIL